MRRPAARSLPAAVLAVALLAIAAPAATADRRDPAPTAAPAAWRAECGSCHVAYPPHLLPADSWRRIVRDLDRHFGTDASVDPATASVIEAFLAGNAAPAGSRRALYATTRITDAGWFRREHADLGAAVWRRAAVGSAANCAACHPDAERGRFDERLVRVPRS